MNHLPFSNVLLVTVSSPRPPRSLAHGHVPQSFNAVETKAFPIPWGPLELGWHWQMVEIEARHQSLDEGYPGKGVVLGEVAHLV